ncbi:hypothetical protein ACFVRU_59975 [Streptomyces sp. NPDC057927]
MINLELVILVVVGFIAAVLTGLIEFNFTQLDTYALYILPILYSEYRIRTGYDNRETSRET